VTDEVIVGSWYVVGRIYAEGDANDKIINVNRGRVELPREKCVSVVHE